eukprot:TRINITY_DN388_c0_g1_i1.p1 TRINITY_DN388_c0_g1~~TRINITY_DN388_c0_g1_i1.p1  ORF type:complete len:283 (-),score=72.98 TRINITY_DN388_c0_g1_i1:106-954(-)
MHSNRLLAVLCFFLLAAALFVRADDPAPESDLPVTEEKEEVKTDAETSEAGTATEKVEESQFDVDEKADMGPLMPSPNITTVIYFPDYSDKHFPLSTEIVALIGVSNSGDTPVNISYIGAHFHSPYDYNYYIQNFTVRELGVSVEPGKQTTLEYRFKPDKSLDALQFWFSGWIIYNNSDDTKVFRSQFHNSTIEMVEPSAEFDAKRIFTYFLYVAVFGLIGYVAYQAVSTKPHSHIVSSSKGSANWGSSKKDFEEKTAREKKKQEAAAELRKKQKSDKSKSS